MMISKCEFQMKTSFLMGMLSSVQSQRGFLLLLVGERVKRRIKYLEIAVKVLQLEKSLFFQLKNTDRRKTNKVQ